MAFNVSAPESLRRLLNLSLQGYHESCATKFDKVVIGVATFKRSQHGPAVLIVQRSPHEEYYPNNFELPGGKVDPGDASILAAVARELGEETGLQVTGILAQLSDITYSTEKTIKGKDGAENFLKKSAIQMNYVVAVKPDEVVLNPEEHNNFLWAKAEDLERLTMTDLMKSTVTEALRWADANLEMLAAA